MARLKVNFKGKVQSRSEASALLQQPGDTVLVERGHPRWVIMKCPDGCGEEIPINVDSRAGPAWRLYQSPRLGLTIYPSIWRDTGCGAHFIVWRDGILLFGGWDEGDDYYSFWDDQNVETLKGAVLKRLVPDKLVHFAEIADDLGELPWDVLRVCRNLVKSGLAVEGKDKKRQHFKRTTEQ